jgi:hypothetical protein
LAYYRSSRYYTRFFPPTPRMLPDPERQSQPTIVADPARLPPPGRS